MSICGLNDNVWVWHEALENGGNDVKVEGNYTLSLLFQLLLFEAALQTPSGLIAVSLYLYIHFFLYF